MTNIRKFTHIPFITLISLFLTINVAYAKAKQGKDYYQVELIIFKYNNANDLSKENWPLNELSIPENVIKVSNSSGNLNTQIDDLAGYTFDFEKEKENLDTNITSNERVGSQQGRQLNNQFYKPLANSELEYSSTAEKIKSNSRYSLISHLGWKLPKKNAILSKPIYFEAGPKHHISGGQHSIEINDIEPGSTDGDTINNQNSDLVTPEISGVIKLQQKKFVHSELDILLSLPATITGDDNKPFEIVKNQTIQTNQGLDNIYNNDNEIANTYIQSFKITESRRLKYNELNYFDHPAFGVIVVIS